MMHQQTSKKFLIYLLFFILLGSVNNQELIKVFNLKITNIVITGLKIEENFDLKKNILNLNLKNLYTINHEYLKNEIYKNSLVEDFFVFKNYPSTLILSVNKTKFFAKIKKNGKTFLVGSNGKLTSSFFENENIPMIFGNPEINDILNFMSIIEKSNMKLDEIKNLFYFKSGRWDIETKKNIIIKLPFGNFLNELNNIHLISKNENFQKKNIIDVRVKNQIISYD